MDFADFGEKPAESLEGGLTAKIQVVMTDDVSISRNITTIKRYVNGSATYTNPTFASNIAVSVDRVEIINAIANSDTGSALKLDVWYRLDITNHYWYLRYYGVRFVIF